jgi:inorganic pyrophosphatase
MFPSGRNAPLRPPLPARAGHGLVNVIIDSPRGSANKYKYDAALEVFRLSRVLPRGMSFPYDFGSIPGTRAADGDPLDVMVITHTASFVGCLMTIRLIGVIEAEQTEGRHTIRNDRLLSVVRTPVNKPTIGQLRDLPKIAIDEIEQFFVTYNRAHGRVFKPIGRRGPRAAEQLLRSCMRQYDTQLR